MKSERKLNIIYTTGGSGSVTTKLSVPKVWVDALGITRDNKGVVATLESDRIVIRKDKGGDSNE